MGTKNAFVNVTNVANVANVANVPPLCRPSRRTRSVVSRNILLNSDAHKIVTPSPMSTTERKS